MSIASFLLGFGFLIYFSIKDILHSEIEHLPLGIMLVIGVSISIIRNEFMISALGAVIFFWISYLLYRKDAVGGGDTKLLTVLPFFFGAVGFPNMFVKLWVFLCLFLIMGVLYAVVWKFGSGKSKKKKKKIPLIPVIAITYALLWIINIR